MQSKDGWLLEGEYSGGAKARRQGESFLISSEVDYPLRLVTRTLVDTGGEFP